MEREVLRLEAVSKAYPSGDGLLTVLHSIDLRIVAGEFVAVVGASGSGKTTLMNILGCLDRPTSGAYHLDGRDVSGLGDDELSRVRNAAIGFVFQSYQLIPQLSVLENVELPLFYHRTPRRERRRRVLELVEAVGLEHRLGHDPTRLSGGECQRVAIARALVCEPRLLLTDEPTGNLDSRNGEEVLQLFHRLHAEGRTLVMVTHNPDIARRLPRVVELRDGRILSDEGDGRRAVLQAAARAPAEA